MNGLSAASKKLRKRLLLIALLYAIFVVYGSLVPLEYRHIRWEEAVARFSAIPFFELDMRSRVDWATNVLLFIPLTFLWMAVLTTDRSNTAKIFATLALIPAATALSLAIEFAQLFFRHRTMSQNDIVAESLGGFVGVLLWWGFGERFIGWVQAWQLPRARRTLAERLAWIYLAGLLIYNVLPLDLTISLVEIFHKWREGKVNLLPFGRLPADPAYALYEIATDALIWVPLALLWRLDGTRNLWRAWGMALFAAVALEVLQLFVFSRVSDVTDLFTAGAGAGLGSLAGGWLARARHAPSGPRPLRDPQFFVLSSVLLPWILAAAWMGVLAFVFWFPFDFRTDGAFIRSRLDLLQRVPFEVYYTGTEFRAVTEMLHKTLFFAPLGALLAWGVRRQAWRWRTPLFALSMLLLAVVPGVIELGQTMLPNKIVDLTDWLLAWIGGVVGYLVAQHILRAPSGFGKTHPEALAAGEAIATPRPLTVLWHFSLALSGMSVLIWIMTNAPFMPYNVRELLRHDSPALSSLLLAAACYWLAVVPVWLARQNVSAIARLGQLPMGLLVYAAVAFWLVRGAVPDESLHDLVGSPILSWPGQWELALRWIGLVAAPGALLYLATQTARRIRGRHIGALHFWAAAPVLLLSYWVVVVQAATDNLIELVAGPQGVGFWALCAWLYTLFLAAVWLASPRVTAKLATRVGAALLSLPFAAIFLYFGLAAEINKYGQQFSALQFLLSTDRQHYGSPATLWLRYSILHLLVIAALAFIQWPHLRSARQVNTPLHVSH